MNLPALSFAMVSYSRRAPDDVVPVVNDCDSLPTVLFARNNLITHNGQFGA